MQKQTQTQSLKITHTLFARIYLYYAVILCLFAVIMGIIFMRLYSESSKDSYRTQLQSQVEAVAARVNEFVKDNDFKGYSAYLEILDELETADIWILANPNATQPLSKEAANAYVEDLDQQELGNLLNMAFQGQTGSMTTYSEIYEMVYVFIAVPVTGNNSEIAGAVLGTAPLGAQTQVINSGKSMIAVSALFTLLISFVIAILFARQLSKPISSMRKTALELADGDYETRTNIRQQNEIGDLAGAIDILAGRLGEAEIDRKNMEQMRLDFFANISHELRTPITVMRAYTETLVDGVVTEEEKIKQYYDRMLSECKSMERLVGDMLVLSKMQNPDFIIEKEEIDLAQIFEEILRSANAIAQEKKISIEYSADRDYYVIWGDYDRLRQMFMIILDNAIKFTAEGGHIYVTITSEEELTISIRDEGIGIAEEDLPYIFEKFYKSKLRQNAKGSGLGLTIAKQIALRHEGEIRVKSELGRGTEFQFVFPKIIDVLS